MIDEALIESDEEGWHLILRGDFELISSRISGGLNLRLSDDAAEELVRQVEQIAEHFTEKEQHRRAYDAASPEERDRVLRRTFPLDRAIDIHREADAELLRSEADFLRKTEKENPPC